MAMKGISVGDSSRNGVSGVFLLLLGGAAHIWLAGWSLTVENGTGVIRLPLSILLLLESNLYSLSLSVCHDITYELKLFLM